MAAFISKKIVSHQTVPEALRQARQVMNKTCRTIAQELQIQPHYLEALEDGAYESIPGEVYARQWLKSYGQYLDLDIRWLIKEYQRERGLQMQFTGFERNTLNSSRWFSWLTPRFFKISGIATVIIGLAVYLGMGVSNILQPPTLVIYEPTNNVITENRVIQISGKTDPEIELTINNEHILANPDGEFSKEITLAPGLNLLTVVATKKHGSRSEQLISIFRQINQVDNDNRSVSFSR
ncbi:MAG: helix-turn-helix domain-containing protein [Candidatus Komeilibacteria bacterium]|nr:helix-turn-helix domain-containing protein [Candidatus Komeilibacteria bacterium]